MPQTCAEKLNSTKCDETRISSYGQDISSVSQLKNIQSQSNKERDREHDLLFFFFSFRTELLFPASSECTENTGFATETKSGSFPRFALCNLVHISKI